MSDTPTLDAVDAAHRRIGGNQDTPRTDDRTPSQKAAEERENEEERLTRNSPAEQRIRKQRAQRYSTVKRALYEVTESIRHGEDLSTAEREAMADKVIADLGGKLPREQVLAFVEVAASSIADGNKVPAWRSAEHTAEIIADSEWRPAPPPEEDTRSTEDIVASISRDRV